LTIVQSITQTGQQLICAF